MVRPDNNCSVLRCNLKNRAKRLKFNFPTNPDLLQYWLYNINRPNYKPDNLSTVCASHFHPDDFEPNGGKRKKYLKKYACPTIFHLPQYHTIFSTKDVELKFLEKKSIQLAEEKTAAIQAQKYAVLKEEVAAMHREKEDFVLDFANFKTQLKDKLDLNSYYLFETDEKCVFFKIENAHECECIISLRISVNSSLKIRILIDDIEDNRHFDRFRITKRRLVKFSQMDSLLEAYRDGKTKPEKVEIKHEGLIKQALQCLISAQRFSSNLAKTEKIDIVINQLENSLKPSQIQFRYNSATMKMAFLLFSHSHATVDTIREFLYLPGKSFLQRMSSNMRIANNFEITLKKDSNLSDPENYIVLIIDEMYIDRGLQYNDNKVVGTAILNPSKDPKNLLLDTKTVIIFTIKSIFGDLQEIIRMSPPIYPFGDMLYSHTKETLEYAHKMGFNVKLIIADTSKNSQRIFQRFSEQSHHFTNPMIPGDQIYLQYDVLHILKDIQNDWNDLTNIDKTFIYPDIETLEIKEAPFTDFESLFESDKLNIENVTINHNEETIKPNYKHGKKVTYKNIFHESTILELRKDDDKCETADFCETIKKWLDIVTTNDPILLNSDKRLKFLDKFLIWIETWRRSRSSNPGLLKSSTFIALEITTKTLVDLINFSFTNCQAEFLSLAKLQKDSLENRFKFYESKLKSNATIESTKNNENLEIIESMQMDESIDWETEDLDVEQDEETYKLSVTINYDGNGQ